MYSVVILFSFFKISYYFEHAMSMESLFHPTNFSFPLCDTLSGVLLIVRLFLIASTMFVFYSTYANTVMDSQMVQWCVLKIIFMMFRNLLTILGPLYTIKIWFVPGLPHSVNKLAIKKTNCSPILLFYNF